MSQTLVTTSPAQYSLLEVALPGEEVFPAGVLLHDPANDRLYIKLRRDWKRVASEEDAEVLAALADDLTAKAMELGSEVLLQHLEDTLSNTLRIAARRAVMVEDFERALERLYRKHVASTVQEFVTHLPRYSVRVAAGKFLENSEIEPEDWVEAPEDLRLTPEMFVAQIVGRSMEPKIPDGSLCVFRSGVTGSREGRLVLVEFLGGGANDRYTVKRYHSEKKQTAEGWRHQRVRLEPLNPEFEPWDLDTEEDRFRIIAEFVRVLE
ncbi:MAG TPA: S24 family peptidase [Bryobacteraceae bacterium]|nr:S24 family peptidase [Bryobacteraceae bacterium]